LLNLGHTFGHAIEADSGYGAVLHGEAVAAGIGLAFRLSAKLGHVQPEEVERVVDHLNAMGLPGDLSHLNRRFSAATLIDHMARDKKMRDAQLHLILPRGIGACETRSDTPPELVREVLTESGCAE
jgi:shikimate kinase/3-dehydroquinate synthase